MENTLFNQLTCLAKWAESEGASLPTLPIINTQDANLSTYNQEVPAYRWKSGLLGGTLLPIDDLPAIGLDDLLGIESQKTAIIRNTEFFLSGKPANNVLLTGARGTGKSSLIRALLRGYYDKGLRIIETDKDSIAHWHPLIKALKHAPEGSYYILYCDDLSFEEGEKSYKMLKSLLDGGFETMPKRVRVYASSNRRHLLPEKMADNLTIQHIDEEIHPGDIIEEKISLSERFGLWLSFYSIEQEAYWAICRHWLIRYGVTPSYIHQDLNALRLSAFTWALTRGGRNGRIAEQFARDKASSLTPLLST